MRAYLAPAMIGIGSMLVSFAAVVFVLELFARGSDAEHRVAAMSALGIETVVAGGALIVLGILLSRLGARRTDARPVRSI
jgi:multisubunit Na+/H+ antiporter MnhF subunit